VVPSLVIAVIGELRRLRLIIPKAIFLIPLTRFPAFVWLIGAVFEIPKSIIRSVESVAA
jgi:hypothetical protein